MKYSDLSFPEPLEYRETWEVLDSSKIQCFMDSPRRFFFEHILGWRYTEPNIHLVFGSAWHEAMEYMMHHPGDNSDEVVMQAFELFMTTFSELGGTFLPAGNKDPDGALRALAMYAENYRTDKFRAIYTEIAGTVPLRLPDRLIHFKLDSIIEMDDGIWSMEHKTTGNAWGWSSGKWSDQWGTKPQVWTYIHALRAMYGKMAKGIYINGVLFGKAKADFRRLPIRKTDDQMQAGLDAMNHWVDQIDYNMQSLAESSASHRTMFAFPCNGVSCSKYGCPWSAFCETWPNPLQRADRPPPGIDVQFWDPRREEGEGAKKVVHLEKQEEKNEQGDA